MLKRRRSMQRKTNCKFIWLFNSNTSVYYYFRIRKHPKWNVRRIAKTHCVVSPSVFRVFLFSSVSFEKVGKLILQCIYLLYTQTSFLIKLQNVSIFCIRNRQVLFFLFVECLSFLKHLQQNHMHRAQSFMLYLVL
jgi:hypothetical protein